MDATGRDARTERLNERLRGAQRTNIGDESFSLDIPGLEQPAPVPVPAAPAIEPPTMSARRAARVERLNERLRGAQRTNIEDESFHLGISGLDQSASAPSAPAFESPPNSAKRRRLDNAPRVSTESAVSTSGGSAIRRSARKSPRHDPYDLPSTSKESGAEQVGAEEPTTVLPSSDRLVPEPDEADLSVVRVIAELERDPLDDIEGLHDSPKPALNTRPAITATRSSVARQPQKQQQQTTKPRGSRVSGEGPFNSSALASSAKLRDAYDAQQTMSSPSERKSTRRSSAATSTRSTRTSGASTRRSPLSRGDAQNDDADELSPDRPRVSVPARQGANGNKQAGRVTTAKAVSSRIPSGSPDDDDVDELSPNRSHEDTRDDEPIPTPRPRKSVIPRPPPAAQPDEREEAEEVDETTAAAAIGKRKRGRPSKKSLDAAPQSPKEPEKEPDDHVETSVAKKRKRGRPSTSPATQKQPTVKPKPKTKTAEAGGRKPRASSPANRRPPKPASRKTSPSPKARQQRRRSGSDDGEDAAFEVTVQRFVHHRRRIKKAADGGDGEGPGDDDDDTDPLQLEIPFANRTVESAVDVFAQLCEEVIGNMLAQFEEHLRNATDAARKKEVRVKIRAVEAYREELNVRLLQHAIHLNNWYTLRKRVRQAQKEKIALRDEILRLRAEREQVALRMDAVRIKHEKESKESSFLLDTSSTMRDIDQAVADGRDAPELPPKALKEAELANLELIVAQVAEQVGGAGGGGMLSQIRDFNAFLERAAVALESR